MAWERGARKGREGAEGVDIDYALAQYGQILLYLGDRSGLPFALSHARRSHLHRGRLSDDETRSRLIVHPDLAAAAARSLSAEEPPWLVIHAVVATGTPDGVFYLPGSQQRAFALSAVNVGNGTLEVDVHVAVDGEPRGALLCETDLTGTCRTSLAQGRSAVYPLSARRRQVVQRFRHGLGCRDVQHEQRRRGCRLVRQLRSMGERECAGGSRLVGYLKCCACGSSGAAVCGAGGVMAWERGRGEGARGRGGR